MPVNEMLATYSDYAFHSAVAVYLIAMVLHLGEYARTRVMVAVSTKRVPVGMAVGGDRTSLPVEPTTATEEPAGRSWPERFGRMAVSLTVLGAALHVVSITLRGFAVHRWPWGNMYEFISAICLMGVLGWLVMLRKTPSMRPAGIWVLLPLEILLFIAGTSLYVKAAPVMPALQSYWLIIHVTAISISSGLLLVSGVASMLFLVRRYGRDNRFTGMLPSVDILDRTAYRICVFAFPLYTFAVMCGAIWGEAAWGRYWGWDPKETVAFVVWVLFACYLHARSTAGWRTGWAAWINVLGFAAVLFNLFFVNLVTTGLHSYAGLS